MEGRGDGGRGRWSYRREQTESSCYTISSSSGTITSTTYTSNTSRLSSVCMDTDILLDTEMHRDVNLSRGEEIERKGTERREQMEHIRSMVQEFFGGTSANMGVLEMWFMELGVGWVVHLSADAASNGELEYTHDEYTSAAQSWIKGIREIMKPIHSTASLISLDVSSGMAIEEQFWIQFAQYTKEVMLKMAVFVDVAIQRVLVPAPAPYQRQLQMPAPLVDFHKMLVVCRALSEALSGIQSSFGYLPSAQVQRIQGEIVSLLSAKGGKASEAIWSTMDCVLKSVDDSLGAPTPLVSSDIHTATRTVFSYIKFMGSFSSYDVNQVLLQFGPKGRSLGSLKEKMLSCLLEKLATRSKTFPDQSLGLLFLHNNLNFVRQELQNNGYSGHYYVSTLLGKVKGCMDRYLQVSWEPVLSCLLNPTPTCFGRNYSPLAKFESEIQKICPIQKQWKVPDPQARKILREAVTLTIIPGYTEYIEDNNVTTPKFTPRELEEMLQELFEG